MNKIIYTFIFLTFFLFAKAPGIPGTEIEIYRIVLPKGKTLDPKLPIPDTYLQPLGKSDGSISTALRGVQVTTEKDEWTGKRMYTYKSGPTFWFWLDDSSWYDSFAFGNMGKTTDFILSKKYQIRPGFPISQTLLDEVEHRTYLDPDGTLTLVFSVTTPDGDFATNLLNITIKDNIVTTIYYGYSE